MFGGTFELHCWYPNKQRLELPQRTTSKHELCSGFLLPKEDYETVIKKADLIE